MITNLLAFSRHIDRLNDFVGRQVKWLILLAILVSAANATSRYALNIASNAFLELQWYLFSTVFILASGYTLLKNEHVRIDLVSTRLSARGRNWVDLLGMLIFIIPVCSYIAVMAVPALFEAIESGEYSVNAGGLIRWPMRALIPLGFALIVLQALSEAIKRWAFLIGRIDDPIPAHQPMDRVPSEKELN